MTLAALRHELAARHVVLSISASGKLRYDAPQPLTPEVLEALRAHRTQLMEELRQTRLSDAQMKRDHAAQPIPALPAPLASLVAAAASDRIKGGAHLSSGFAPDLATYVLAWAATYLIGDQSQALNRLMEADSAWRQVHQA